MQSDPIQGSNIDDAEFLRLRRLADVDRWGIVPTIRRQTVDQHSFHVLHGALWLAARHASLHDRKHWGEILLWALVHDGDESVTGDMATPVKRVLKRKGIDISEALGIARRQYVHSIANLVKVADCLEALLFLQEEVAMGNKRVMEVMSDITDALEQHWGLFDHRWPESKPTHHQLWNEFLRTYDPYAHPGMAMERLHD